MTTKCLLPLSFKHFSSGLSQSSSRDKDFLLSRKDCFGVWNTHITGSTWIFIISIYLTWSENFSENYLGIMVLSVLLNIFHKHKITKIIKSAKILWYLILKAFQKNFFLWKIKKRFFLNVPTLKVKLTLHTKKHFVANLKGRSNQRSDSASKLSSSKFFLIFYVHKIFF